MAIQQIDKSGRKMFVDISDRTVAGNQAEAEVASLDVVGQIGAERGPLVGIPYRREGDLIEIAAEGADNLIASSHKIYFDYNAGRLISVLAPGEAAHPEPAP